MMLRNAPDLTDNAARNLRNARCSNCRTRPLEMPKRLPISA